MTDSVFLFSSATGIPDRWFSGYCFAGRDFIADAEGTRQYREATGLEVPFGEDGCYVAIVPHGNGRMIGADFKGYKHLYYYTQDRVWAFSNSLMALVSHLREQGVSLTVDRAQLRAWSHPKPFTAQPASFSTAVSEIRILPSFYRLDLAEGQLSPVARELPEPGAYAGALKQYLEIWLSRISGLMHEGRLSLIADLTGGRDSRALLSFFLAARERLGIAQATTNLYLRADKKPRLAKDLAIAQALARHYDLRLNQKTPKPLPLAAHHAYEDWKALCLGIYTPVYFPYTLNSSRHIYFGGGGGESHRPFYPLIAPEQYLRSKQKGFAEKALVTRWQQDVLGAVDTLQRRNPADIHPLILHYREFRDRFHVGRTLQYYIMCAPLGSRWLMACSDVCTREHLESNQILYDIMANLAPGLAGHHYDEDYKSPSPDNLARVTRVSLDDDLPVGRVFGGEAEATQYTGESTIKQCIAQLRDDLAERRADILAAGIELAEVEETLAQLDAAVDKGGFNHSSEGRRAAWLLLAGELHHQIGRYR
ncbi:hypothetical protein ACS8E6_08470 [Salinicola halophyticus]|uniref:hypothetical protein n=1 Tax=Salinicola halophyticus TaxID=1808881 RepID=UPI003F474796